VERGMSRIFLSGAVIFSSRANLFGISLDICTFCKVDIYSLIGKV
jgi:hypothetical protein